MALDDLVRRDESIEHAVACVPIHLCGASISMPGDRRARTVCAQSTACTSRQHGRHTSSRSCVHDSISQHVHCPLWVICTTLSRTVIRPVRATLPEYAATVNATGVSPA